METRTQNAPQDRAQDTATGKKPRGRPFTGRDDPRNGNSRTPADQAVPNAADMAAVAEDSSLYDDMRHVRRFPKPMDRTEGHRSARKWLNKDLKGFMAAFAGLEKANAGAKPPDQGQPAPYDGRGPCPTCHREPEVDSECPLEEMAEEWKLVSEFDKHKDEFRAWLAAGRPVAVA